MMDTKQRQLYNELIDEILAGEDIRKFYAPPEYDSDESVEDVLENNTYDECYMNMTKRIIMRQLVEKWKKFNPQRVFELDNEHITVMNSLDTHPHYKDTLEGNIFYIDCLYHVLKANALTDDERVSLQGLKYKE